MNIKIKLEILTCLIFFTFSQASAMEVILQCRADELYDDNINSSSNSPESDWVTNMMLGLALKSEMRELDFALSGNVYQRFYFNNSENNTNYQDLSLLINKSFTETVFFKLTDVFQNYPDPDNFGTMFGRNDTATGYKSNILTTTFSAYATKEFFFDILYKNRVIRNDNEAMLDTELHSPGGDFGYSFNSANLLKVGYLYTLMKYENEDEIKGHRGYAEYEKYFTKQTRIILHGGYDYIEANGREDSGSRWMASIIDDVDIINQLNITFLKENAISDTSNDTFNNWRISASFKRELGSRVRGDLSLFYGKGVFEISKIENKLAGTSIRLAFIINEFINFNIGYTHTWNRMEAPYSEETTYRRNQVSAGLSAIY